MDYLHQELVSIVCRPGWSSLGSPMRWPAGHEGGYRMFCLPEQEASRLVCNLITSTSDDSPGWIESSYDRRAEVTFGLIAPAPKGLIVIDFEEMVILDYHGSKSPARMAIVDGYTNMPTYERFRAALANDRIIRVENSLRTLAGPFEAASVKDLIQEVRGKFGTGWVTTSAVLDTRPWQVEWYGPYPDKNNAKAMLARIKDTTLEFSPSDQFRWNKHFKDPHYMHLF
jgi:hypothetical protein